MLMISTKFRIEREPERWTLIDKASGQPVAFSSTFNGAIRAAEEIEAGPIEPIAQTGFREVYNADLVARVLAARGMRV